MVTVAGVPTGLVRAASVNNLIWKVSLPSVVRSLARVWESMIMPIPVASLTTLAWPDSPPALKSAAVMLVPLITQ